MAVQAMFLSVGEAAEALGISVSNIRLLIRKGKIPATQIGGTGRVLIPASLIDGLLADAMRSVKKGRTDER